MFLRKRKIKINETKEKNMICPRCGGDLVERKGKYGKFIGCTNYPKCKFALWDKPTGDFCPECGKVLVEKTMVMSRMWKAFVG